MASKEIHNAIRTKSSSQIRLLHKDFETLIFIMLMDFINVNYGFSYYSIYFQEIKHKLD